MILELFLSLTEILKKRKVMQLHNKSINILVRSILLLVLFIFSFSGGLKAQLVIRDNYYKPDATALFQKYFANSGIRINNVEVTQVYTDETNVMKSLGSFTGGDTSTLGIREGIVISTGLVANIPGSISNTASDSLGTFGCEDLDTLLQPGTFPNYDATVIKIDFTPLTDSIWFRYVFASEEFPPYIAERKDVFGFFLNGPKPSPLTGNYENYNIALFPGTNTPIKIDSFANAPYSNYLNNHGPADIKFDKLTKLMTAGCKVTACSQYTLYIAIEDVITRYYDSGLFLEGGSLTSTSKSVSVKGTNGDNGMVEKCGTATFVFKREYVTSTPETLNFIIEGTATRIATTDSIRDYTDTLDNDVPTFVVFPPYKKTVELKVKAVDDERKELTETIIVKLPGLSQCGDSVKAVLYLKNTDRLAVSAGNDTTICYENGNANLYATVTGGVPPYKYFWLKEQDNDSSSTTQGSSTYMAKPEPENGDEKPFYLYHVLIYDSCMTELRSNDVTVFIKCPIKTTNVITPNGDTYNDKFVIKHLIEYPGSKLVILNRWGKKVFETNNYQNDWDGGNLAEGVYFFIIELPDKTKYQGSVTILR